MTIIGVYLPPENSFHGRDGDVVFNYINALFYQYQDESDILLLCGDINARIGNVNDVKEDFNVFTIASRLTCDNITNGHGKRFLDFLYDNDICVLNGRFGSESNNFTSTSTRGKAVVDYMVLPHDQLQFVNNFKIITMNEISSILKKYVTDKCKLPDHSILYFNVRMSYNINAMHGGGQQDMQHVQNCEKIFIKKYTFDVIPK